MRRYRGHDGAAGLRGHPISVSAVSTNLSRLTGEIPEGAQAHHVLPQQFASRFKALGLDIHDPRFGAWWGPGHQQHAAEYNRAWNAFLSTNPTTEQTLQFARGIAGCYGLTTHF